MKRLLTTILLLLMLAASAQATDITIASTTVTQWVGPTSGIELRGFLSSTLTVPSGTPLSFTANATTDLLTAAGHSLVVGNAIYLSIGTAGVLPTGLSEGTRYYVISVSGNDLGISTTAGGAAINFTSNGSGTIYILTSTTSYPASSPETGVTQWRFACTVSSSTLGGITVYTLTIPSITIPATTNAVSGYGARWQFWFYRSTGAKIARWSGYENLRIPTSAASTTWDAIKIYNNDTIATADSSTYTKSEIDALLISCCSGGGGGGSAYNRIQEEGSDLTQRTTLNFVGAGFTAADNSTRTNLTLDDDLNALAGLASTGFIARTGTATYALRTITGRTDQITVVNGSGGSGNVELQIPDFFTIGSDGTGGILNIKPPGVPYNVQIQGPQSGMTGSYVWTLPSSLPASTLCVTVSSVGQLSYGACSGGGGGAPTNVQYLVLTTDGTLTDERRLVPNTGLTGSDSGAGGDYLLGIDTTWAQQWTGKGTWTVGTNTTSVEALLITKANRTTDGQTDSDYITWQGKGRNSSTNYTSEWRANVDVIDNSGIGDWILRNRINGGALTTAFRLGMGGDLDVLGSITAGSGNIVIANTTGNLRVEAFASASLSGITNKLVTTDGTLTPGNCAEWDADGNLIEASGACGGGSPGGSNLDYQINNAGSLGPGNLKDLSGGIVSITNGSGAGGSIRAQAYTQTQITADTNNLTAGGRSFNLYLSTDAARTVRGLTFSGFTQVDGELHLIQNTGTYPLLLTNEDSSATAANRFRTASGRTVTLLGDRAALTVWDDTIDRHRVFPLAVNAPELLHTNTTIPTVNNTTTETSLLTSTFTTPANFFTVGRTLRVQITGIINTAVSAPTLRIKLKAGSTVLVESTAVTMTSLGGTARSFTATVAVLCTSVGASGAFDGNGQWMYNTAANGVSGIELVNQVATANTTGALTWDVTAQWGTANAQNTISITSLVATAY